MFLSGVAIIYVQVFEKFLVCLGFIRFWCYVITLRLLLFTVKSSLHLFKLGFDGGECNPSRDQKSKLGFVCSGCFR